MLYLYLLLYIVYIIIYRENKTVCVFLIGGRASWCWWVISPGGGRCVPRRWEFLLVLVGDRFRRWAVCSSSVGGSWCCWVISPDGGRVPHRCAFLLVLVGDKSRRWAVCSSSVGVPPGVGG